MPILSIASKANQATTIPALLVASFANDTQDASIDINFEDGAALPGLEREESTRLVTDDGTSISGVESIVRKLIELYPALTAVHKEMVSEVSICGVTVIDGVG